MGRLTSCSDAFSLMAFVQLLLLLASTAETAVAGKVLFPDELPCTLKTGETGRYLPLPDCPSVLQTFKELPSIPSSFEGFTKIVCCPKGQDTTTKSPGELPQHLENISPPTGYDTLGCGRSAVKTIRAPGPSFGLSASGASLSRQKRANVPSSHFLPEDSRTEPPIVGGQTSERAAWPWMALLGRRDEVGLHWFCGGALINKQWVLTALHCFHRFKADVVRLGEHDYARDDDWAEYDDFGVAEMVLYPDYKPPEAYHDLALLRLDREVKLQRFILPVCLPWGNKSEENIVNTTATIVGWGHTLYGGLPSSVLMEADVQVFPSSRCDDNYSSLPDYPRKWPHGIGEENLCAGDPDGGKDSCQGDSGGPMVIRDSSRRYIAVGVVSRGFGCGHKDYPGLYANLHYPPYLAWIKKIAFGPQ